MSDKIFILIYILVIGILSILLNFVISYKSKEVLGIANIIIMMFAAGKIGNYYCKYERKK